MINTMRGEFQATLAGEAFLFDTRLGTIAAIEDRCGDLPIVEIVNKAVFGRRARDRIALLAAALMSTGRGSAEAEAQAALASVSEAEAFILALMRALGFEVAPRGGEGEPPLDGVSTGDAGAPSRSAG